MKYAEGNDKQVLRVRLTSSGGKTIAGENDRAKLQYMGPSRFSELAYVVADQMTDPLNTAEINFRELVV